ARESATPASVAGAGSRAIARETERAHTVAVSRAAFSSITSGRPASSSYDSAKSRPAASTSPSRAAIAARLGHAAEQPALGDTLQPLVELPQHGECVVDRDQCHGVAIESGDVMHECYRTMAAPALERGARPDVVDNGAPHGTGGN